MYMPKSLLNDLLLNDLLLVDKPSGISSFDVIRRLQREPEYAGRKMGHAGTLDPLASGLMIIGVDSGTKHLVELLGLSKVYEAEILLGTKTDSGDTQGKVLEQWGEGQLADFLATLNEKRLVETLESMKGTLLLAVPIYSAIKRQGKKLYELAREGKTAEEIKPPVKEMTVRGVKLLGWDGEKVRVRFDVSSGTYVRSLAEEFGRRLAAPATMSALRRTEIGTFSVENARKI